MKDFIVSLLSVIIGTSLLSVSVISGKFAKNIKVLVTVILVLSVLQGLPSFEFNSFSESLPLNGYTEYNNSAKENSVEAVLNDSVEKNIRQCFGVDVVSVEIDVVLNESYIEIKSLKVCVSTDTELLNILDYLENTLKIPGKIYVTRIKDEGEKTE